MEWNEFGMRGSEIEQVPGAVRDLLAGCCSSLCGRVAAASGADAGREAPVLGSASLVELRCMPDGRLAVGGGGALLTADTAPEEIAAGRYELHVFDTPAEARAAANLAQRVGGTIGQRVSHAVLATGEAVCLCEATQGGDADWAGLRTVGPARVQICDHREAGHDLVVSEIVLSLDYGAAEITRWRAEARPVAEAIQSRRGRTLARKMRAGLAGEGAVRAAQREVDSFPGAWVPMVQISSRSVMGALDEVADEVGTELVLPPEREVRRALAAEAARIGAGTESLVRRVALRLMFGEGQAAG